MKSFCLSRSSFLMESEQNSIKKVLEYAISLINIPYRWHKSGDKIPGDDKFWASNGGMISREYIKKENKCIVCTGLINLMRRFQGLSIPGLDGELGEIGLLFPGTTGIWFLYLKPHLEILDIQKKYPNGTLLLRNYDNDETDQGHVAVLITDSNNCIIEENIIHAFAEKDYTLSSNNENVGRTAITSFRDSHYWDGTDGYYTHICLPQYWLCK